MGEVSKNIVALLAVVVIAVSAVGTYMVMDTANSAFSGVYVPLTSELDEQVLVGGQVNVWLNGTYMPIDLPEQNPSTLSLTGGMVNVYVESPQ